MAIMIIRAIFRPLSQLRGSRLPKTTNAAAASATCQRSHRTAACAIAASRYWTQDDRCPFPALALWPDRRRARLPRSEEHTSELQSLLRISYAVFCLKKKTKIRESLYILNHTT